MSDERSFRRIALLKRLGWLALAGLISALIGFAYAGSPDNPPPWLLAGFVLIAPAVVYLVMLEAPVAMRAPMTFIDRGHNLAPNWKRCAGRVRGWLW